MELDELKKSWNALDNKLEQHPLLNEKEMNDLIAAGRKQTRQGLRRLSLVQGISLCIGIILFAVLILAWLFVPDFLTGQGKPSQRIFVLLAFLIASLLIGVIWDWKTFQWVKSIEIDRMSVVEVSRRMTIFRKRLKQEIIAVCVWVVVFNALNFWVMGYHLASPATQAVVIALLAVADALIIYLFYKKVIYKHLNDIHKNIEELKDICTE